MNISFLGFWDKKFIPQVPPLKGERGSDPKTISVLGWSSLMPSVNVVGPVDPEIPQDGHLYFVYIDDILILI